MTKQEIFDRVVEHLRKQGEVAYDEEEDLCCYRYGELRCALGCLISDDQYDEDLEGKTIGTKRVKEALGESLGIEITGTVVELLRELQNVHDNGCPPDWEYRWQSIAQRFRLEFEPLRRDDLGVSSV